MILVVLPVVLHTFADIYSNCMRTVPIVSTCKGKDTTSVRALHAGSYHIPVYSMLFTHLAK